MSNIVSQHSSEPFIHQSDLLTVLATYGFSQTVCHRTSFACHRTQGLFSGCRCC